MNDKKQGGAGQNDPDPGAQNTKILTFVNVVSAAIMIAAVGITLFLATMMATQLEKINTDPNTVAIEKIDARFAKDQTIKPDLVSRAYLEHDAQFLRTKRAQTLVSAKLFISSLAVMAGLLLVTMGSAFIFARIRTPQSNLEIGGGVKLSGDTPVDTETAKRRPWLVFSSYSPGLFFGLFGTILILYAVNTSADHVFKTDDLPVFVENYNSGVRTQSGDPTSVTNKKGKYVPSDICKVIKDDNRGFCEAWKKENGG